MIRIPVANLADLQPGSEWSSEIHNRQNLCRLVCVAFHMRSHQQVVVYQVQGGKDDGCFCCTPSLEFVTKFRRMPAAEPVLEETAMVADMSEKGKGF